MQRNRWAKSFAKGNGRSVIKHHVSANTWHVLQLYQNI